MLIPQELQLSPVYLWFKPKVQLNRELNQELVSPLIASKLLITGVE